MTCKVVYKAKLNYTLLHYVPRDLVLKKLSLKLEVISKCKKFVYVDIRCFTKNKPTENGICITLFEFHQIINHLKNSSGEIKETNIQGIKRFGYNEDKNGLRIIPTVFENGVTIEKKKNGQPTCIFLDEQEINQLILTHKKVVKMIYKKIYLFDNYTEDYKHDHNCIFI